MSFFGNIHGQGGHGRGLMWDSTLGGWRWTEVMSSRYRDVAAAATSGQSTATQTAAGGPYIFIPSGTLPAFSGSNAGSGGFPLDPADYLSTALATKLRIKCACITNATAPAVTFTIALQKITASAGGAAATSLTLAAALTSVAFASPGASNGGATAAGTDIDFPAAGVYVVTLTVSGTPAASSNTVLVPRLQYRYV